jgi:hypothetical protein
VCTNHLVDGNDDLLHTEGEGEQSVLAELSSLGIRRLELTGGGRDHEDSDIGLRGSYTHKGEHTDQQTGR